MTTFKDYFYCEDCRGGLAEDPESIPGLPQNAG